VAADGAQRHQAHYAVHRFAELQLDKLQVSNSPLPAASRLPHCCCCYCWHLNQPCS
jgi:hypothetical protein